MFAEKYAGGLVGVAASDGADVEEVMEGASADETIVVDAATLLSAELSPGGGLQWSVEPDPDMAFRRSGARVCASWSGRAWPCVSVCACVSH
jgi:hypothetical protein